jgi:arylsulfatase
MPPNILLITGDHVRCDALSCYSDPSGTHSLASRVRTPHLDTLADEGVRFTNCFTPNPICVPARASITTGNYSHKATGTKDQRVNGAGSIKDDQPKLAEHFARHGYQTYAVGKLHYLPYTPPGAPRLLHGFQHAELCEEGRILRRFDPDGLMRGLEDYHDYLYGVGWGGYERSHGVGNNDVHPAPVVFPAEHHEEAWVAKRTIANIQHHVASHPNKPFLMWSSFTKPHPPYDPPSPYDRMYDPRSLPMPLAAEDENIMNDRDIELRARKQHYGWNKLSPEAVQVIRSHYCGLMSFQDAMVGQITGYLKRAGKYDDTVILYTSDHGDLLGDFGRFFKHSMFDASIKVPLIIRIPGAATTRSLNVRDQLVGLQDLFPTLCVAASIDVPAGGIDGQELMQIIEDPRSTGRSFIVSQTRDHPVQKYMVRTRRWKYIYTEVGGIEELYEIDGPDYELRNVASEAEHAHTLADLRHTLISWCQENGDHAMLERGNLRASDPAAISTEELFQPGNLAWRKY